MQHTKNDDWVATIILFCVEHKKCSSGNIQLENHKLLSAFYLCDLNF